MHAFSHARSIHSYWYAKWDGKKWNNIKITDAALCFMRNDYNNKNYLETEEIIREEFIWIMRTLLLCILPVRLIMLFEIEKWTLTGNENIWKSEAVTKDSERDNIRPVCSS